MGMFDNIIVEKDNIFGIVDADYQSKSLNCALDTYTIYKDGTIAITDILTDSFQWWIHETNTPDPKRLPARLTNINGVFNIYGDDKDGGWYEYDMYVEDGKVVKVVEWGGVCTDFDFDNVNYEYDLGNEEN